MPSTRAAPAKVPATAPAAAPAATPAAAPAKSPAVKAAVKAALTTAPTPKAAPVKAGPAKPAAAKPAAAKALAAPAPAPAPRASKAPKVRQKPVRDSFTMPEADFSLIATLKARALAGKRETKKSELLRAGLHALAAMDSAALLAALHALEPIKTGRPRKGH